MLFVSSFPPRPDLLFFVPPLLIRLLPTLSTLKSSKDATRRLSKGSRPKSSRRTPNSLVLDLNPPPSPLSLEEQEPKLDLPRWFRDLVELRRNRRRRRSRSRLRSRFVALLSLLTRRRLFVELAFVSLRDRTLLSR